MFEQLCEDEHDAHAMKIVHRAFLGVTLVFVVLGGVAITTRMGKAAPPTSVAYGTEKAHPTAVVFGD